MYRVDVFAENPLEHPLDTCGDLVEVQRHRLHDLPAAECKELTRERHRPVSGLHNLEEVFALGITLTHAVQHESRVAQDHGEEVVEVVRHASGEIADGLHFL